MTKALVAGRPTRVLVPSWAPPLMGGQARAAFVVFGGLAVLQSSDGLGLLKVGYLLGVAIALVGALNNLRRLEATRSYILLRPLLGVSLLFAALVALSLGVAIAHGTPTTAWLRDAAPYFLLASVPVFALDLHASGSRKVVIAMFVIAGLLASFSHTVEWLDRRQLADLPFARIALPSPGLLSAVFIFAISGALLGRGSRTGWVLLSALVLSLVWLTANRASSLALPLAALVVVGFAFARDRQLLRPTLRLLTIGGLALLLTLVFTQSLARFTDYDTSRLIERFGSITTVSAGPGTDASYQERSVQTRLAWQTFISEPILGAGPGHSFEWEDYRGEPAADFHIDTSLSLLAKFGVAGMVLIAALAIAVVSFLRTVARRSGITVAQAALVGYAALALLISPFAVPLEDKGFSFGLLFLLALSLPRERGGDEA